MTAVIAETLPFPPSDGPEDGSWADPPRRPAVTSSPVLAVDGFEGPLDWLLEMVRARKLDLARLSILALVEAFVDAMDRALTPGVAVAELARWAAWTVMAAQLTELRSRLMLPAEAPDAQAAQAEAEALRRHWISRAEMAAAADWLERRPQLGRDVFARGRAEPAWSGQGAGSGRTVSDPDVAVDDGGGPAGEGSDDLTALLRACLVALRLPADQAVYQPRPRLFWSFSDATKRIIQMLPTLPDGGALEMFLPESLEQGAGRALDRRAALAATLVAGLELARGGEITLRQETIGQPIHVS